jgi:ribonuclease HI
MNGQPIIVFTDGSSKGNPGPGGWGAIIVSPAGQVTELGGGAPLTTNNKMELSGAIAALSHIASHMASLAGPVEIYTDSTYVIQGIREWIHNWKRRGWRTATGAEVMNRDLWEALSSLTSARGPRAITWHYVRGHIGTPGNERVDTIADAFATLQPVTLYDGPLSDYDVDIFTLPDDTKVPPRSKSSGTGGGSAGGGRSKGPAYSYLSVVDGKPMRHATWAECERRVTGRSGARFKKAMNADEQATILREWKFRPEDV